MTAKAVAPTAVAPSVSTPRPTLADLRAAVALDLSVEVTAARRAGKFAGLYADHTPRTYPVRTVERFGDEYMKALAEDDRLVVRLIEAR